jgi:hypothetical protein
MVNIFRFLIIFLFSIFIGCKNNSKLIDKKNKLDEKDSIFFKTSNAVKIIDNDVFSLKIKTKFSKDTLNNLDYKEDKYSSPIILEQYILFFKNDNLIKESKTSIESITRKTIKNTYFNILRTPIYEVGLVKSKDKLYYIILGSDYCNGSNCLEFIGIYSSLGNVIYEGVPNYKKKELKQILLEHKIDINNRIQTIEIEL